MKNTCDSLSRRINTVGEITAGRPLLTFRAEDKIEHIVREMIKRHEGAVGITDADAAGKLVGLLTERDILCKIFGTDGETQAQFNERNQHLSVYPGSLVARDVMISQPICLVEHMLVDEGLEKIKRHSFRYMPVVDKEGGKKLVGIVSERELFWHTQEKLRRTIQAQTNLLSYFIHEPYGGGAAIDTTH